MRRLAYILVAISLMVGLIGIIGCGDGTVSPPSKATTPDELASRVEISMTLDEVYSLMNEDLEKQMMILPALNIEESGTQWILTAKEGAKPGDKDAPYQALFCLQAGQNSGFYVIFFQDEIVMEDGWFDYGTQTRMMKLLWTTESTD